MSNIKITIEGVEKEYWNVGYSNSKEGDFFFKGTYYREVEPVKQGYEILSFRSNNGNVWGNYSSTLYVCSNLPRATHTLQEMLDVVKSGQISIHSVRRLPDGEVFSVEEDEKNIGKIEKIELFWDSIRLRHGEQAWVMLKYACKVKQPPILLRTEDGVEITDGEQVIYWCYKDLEPCDSWAKNLEGNNSDCKHFSTSEARDEYILYNKPVTVTLKEIIKIYRDCLDDESTIEDDHIEFFKSKQK